MQVINEQVFSLTVNPEKKIGAISELKCAFLSTKMHTLIPKNDITEPKVKLLI